MTRRLVVVFLAVLVFVEAGTMTALTFYGAR